MSGRGETKDQAWERWVQDSGLAWTIVRASWFSQDFAEGTFVDMVRSGQITMPAGETKAPFVDVDDMAEVTIAALVESGPGDRSPTTPASTACVHPVHPRRWYG